MKAQHALDFIRQTLCAKYHLSALDVATRSKAQYFRTPENKVFGLLVGDLDGNTFKYGTADLLLEPIQLPAFLENYAEIIPRPYHGSSTEQPTKGVFLKQAQTRVRVQSELGLEAVLAWYASHLALDRYSSPLPAEVTA